ncbi:MAG TPA: hypothetical protein VH184_09530 [Dongiaceae bacterium]|jgi:hypothetical protein|nr:hypothetical protein [Dongiaceae bacterium]
MADPRRRVFEVVVLGSQRGAPFERVETTPAPPAVLSSGLRRTERPIAESGPMLAALG